MITASEDVMILTRAEFQRLPEGFWEVVDGRAILLPAPEYEHQEVAGALFLELSRALKALGRGHVVCTVNVFAPVRPRVHAEIQNRIPDLVVSLHRPKGNFEIGQPPELVVEILSTPRGNVERSEKLDDYARARVPEYWIVDPFHRAVEVYLLNNGDYVLSATVAGALRSAAIPGLEIDLGAVWQTAC
ncbi:MAG: Uma2 family endonuclease [Acidobacteria bacterium]|nr:Uma2 family endonuclease [Acidobacteriota bacterium]MBI3471195.1 Uma2 family endonuclease [Candidatus Solibacter usitatus]